MRPTGQPVQGERRVPWTGVAALLIAAYVVGVLPSIGQSLLESHAHRQTQTAYTALLFARDGIDLLSSPLPILGPPGDLPQEFPLLQAMGALIIDLGVHPDMAMRIAGLVTFVVAAWFVWLLSRRLVGELGATVALGAFLFNPLAWVYGRASLIEYLAVAGSVAFLYFGSRWLDGRHRLHWVLALLAGTLAVLVKITTGAFYLLPLLLWRDRSGSGGYRRWSAWALVALPMIAGIGWSLYAQSVREQTPASAFLSLSNQFGWFFGSFATRFDLAAWRVPLVAVIGLTGFGFLLWGGLAVLELKAHPQRAFLAALLALAVVVPLTLFNLYAIHDYYWLAVSPSIAVGIGVGARWLQHRFARRRARRLAVVLAGAWLATVIATFGTWSIIYGTPAEQAKTLGVAGFIADNSSPEDWVVLRGFSWNSTFLYYARRQGLAVPEPTDPRTGIVTVQDLSDVDLPAILSDPVFGPLITCDLNGICRVRE